jgi:hypothetical protein
MKSSAKFGFFAFVSSSSIFGQTCDNSLIFNRAPLLETDSNEYYRSIVTSVNRNTDYIN